MIDPNKVNTRQRGSYKKRVKERLQEIGGDHFKIALSYVPTKERLDLIKNVLESLPISSSEVKTFLKYQYSNVEDIENFENSESIYYHENDKPPLLISFRSNPK